MRRCTLNFSMYSDMSMRTMARSLSNKYSASAFASSVLPTPVGPRNMNDPMGLSGSERPARLRRMAPATTFTAWSWPITRSWSFASKSTSFSISPFIILLTGMPVQALTTSAISSSVTSFLRRDPFSSSSLNCSSAVAKRCLSSGMVA